MNTMPQRQNSTGTAQLHHWPSRLTGTHHPVHAHVVRRGADAIVIDPPADLTLDVLRGLGVERVTRVLITHVQAENIAGAANFPGAAIHVPAGDEYLCEGDEAYRQHITKWVEPWEWETRGDFKGHLAGAANERPAPQALSLSASLQPGTSIEGFNVLATPGHGKHAVTLIVTIGQKRVAFCGGLIYGDGKVWNWFDCDWDYGLCNGYRTLLDSVRRLRAAKPDVLCPTHGPVIEDADAALAELEARLERVLAPVAIPEIDRAAAAMSGPVNFPDLDSRAPGFRQLSPHLHQWKGTWGNCAVLVSESREAMLIDDGLCHWEPLPQRAEHHQRVMADMKKALGVSRVSAVIITHYHGDHLENIPQIVASDGAEVICLDTVADVVEHPERFNLACPLPWYGTEFDSVRVDRRVPDGYRLRWHEYELEIFHLGGQTYYHAGIFGLIDGARVLFAGDSANFGVQPEPIVTYNDAEPTRRGQLYATERAIERRPDLLVCGHAVAIRDPMPLLHAKRRAWAARMDDYRALNPRATWDEFFRPF